MIDFPINVINVEREYGWRGGESAHDPAEKPAGGFWLSNAREICVILSFSYSNPPR
jgi:hypothetical protein